MTSFQISPVIALPIAYPKEIVVDIDKLNHPLRTPHVSPRTCLPNKMQYNLDPESQSYQGKEEQACNEESWFSKSQTTAIAAPSRFERHRYAVQASVLVSRIPFTYLFCLGCSRPLTSRNLCLDEALPVFSLGSSGTIPPALLREIIDFSAPNVSLLFKESLGGHFAYDGDKLVAFVDSTTGETQVFPDVGSIPPAEGAEINITRAFQFVNLNETLPKDHTNVIVVLGNGLIGVDFLPGEQSTPVPQVYLTNALVQRNTTTNGGRKLIKPNSTKTMYDYIKASLTPIGKVTGLVEVEGIDLYFYDSGSKFIQPDIRVWSTIHADTINSTVIPSRIEFYFPVGKGSPEVLPPMVVSKDSVPDPVLPNSECHAGASKTIDRRGVLPNIKVRRYVVRDDVKQWVTNAQNFLSNLRKSSLFANFVDS
ncbi:hypothetical protein BDQ17DRAFT_1431441 [Cyathus striatus]|nr:hypothetical protein BDQ17DRAFT_1431441 [Cyathus striatus]